MTSRIGTTAKREKLPVVAALGAACALTVAIGLVVWQGGQPGRETAPVVQALGQAPTIAAAADPGNRPDRAIATDGSLGTLVPTADRAGVAPTIIIVATADAAEAMPITNNTAVIVVRSATEEHRLLMTIAHADAVNAEQGLPALTLVDRRGT